MLRISDITEDLAVALLRYECKLRKSDEIQDYYTFLDNSEEGRRETVENYVQFKTIRKFGYDPTWESISEYRKMADKFSDSEKVRDAAYYLKYNIFTCGNLKVSDQSPDVGLVDLENKPCRLSEYLDTENNKPLVIFAGSIS
jgi:hypothetical protein